MPKVSRIGDRTIGTCTHPPIPLHPNPSSPIGGQIITSSAVTSIEGKLVARVGDTVLADCGHSGIIDSGGSINIENNPVARVGDTFSGVYNGNIIEGCDNFEVD